MELEIHKKNKLKSVPSASGLEIHKNNFYVVGDNCPWLFKLDTTYRILKKIPIHNSEIEVIEKKFKPDFEAMTMVKNLNSDELFIFGSGSKSPHRDGLVRVLLEHNHKVIHFSLSKFYAKIRKSSGLNSKNFNIEAATSDNQNLYLFNRGKNRVFVFKLIEFINYIGGATIIPKPIIFKIKVPKLNNIKAGISGASITPDQKHIILTASVEITSNTYDDGEILGSFIGRIAIKNLTKNLSPKFTLITHNNLPLKIKVESVSISQIHTNKDIFVQLVTDSDGKESEFIEGVLKT